MQIFFCQGLMMLPILLTLLSSCQEQPRTWSREKSDWEAPADTNELRNYIVDWACEPKQWGNAAEKKISGQDEYCEWRTEKVTTTEKQCRFTTSFDDSRDFSLNSRNQTPFNTIAAARYLVRDCNSIALKQIKAGKPAGKLCSGLTEGCKSSRNSDPEICDKVRWASSEKFAKRIDYCIDQLSPSDAVSTPQALISFGLLTDLPDNCVFNAEDHTEVLCTIPVEDDCFSVAGQLRPGLRVITKSSGSIATLPKSKQCFTP